MENIKKQLYWACHRGMLELDLMLIPFLEHRYSHLSAIEQQTFEDLLHFPDPEIYSWLTQKGSPDDAKLKAMVNEIHAFAQYYARDRQRNHPSSTD